MKLGDLILEHRTRLDMSQEDVVKRLSLHGFNLSRAAISKWERKAPQPDDIAWNPRFIEALADIFGTTPVELLHELGFTYLPEGFEPEDVALALAIRGVEDVKKREKLVRGLLAILELFEDDE